MKYTIFGESHGPCIGVTLTGVPFGIEVDTDFLASELARRAPGASPLSTSRCESDAFTILSGVYEGKTTGTPLTAVIPNTDTHSKDYGNLLETPRPSHGDYAGTVRYGGCNDPRGGGHFSGRLTAPLVFAGGLAKLILAESGVTVTAGIDAVGGVVSPTEAQLAEVILAAKNDGDSVGGVISCAISGLPAGLGDPDLDCNAEGIFARHLFAIPAVKGVEFGDGFALAALRGSEANDPFCMKNGVVATQTNRSGGVNGGITNGMPLTFRAAFRPTPSIAKAQKTVNLVTQTETTLSVSGRHDPCIVPRAVVVVESAAALAALELFGI
ncbi:MAG: chorismate synthase [Oscillospiraceae bacterium]